MKDLIRKELERILLPSDIMEGTMKGITKDEADNARKEYRQPNHILQDCFYFTYCGVDFDILLDDKVIMADEKIYSYDFKSPQDVVPTIKSVINRRTSP